MTTVATNAATMLPTAIQPAHGSPMRRPTAMSTSSDSSGNAGMNHTAWTSVGMWGACSVARGHDGTNEGK